MRRSLSAGGVLALAVALMGTPAQAASVPRIEWKSCDDAQHPMLQCGTIEVPLDHSAPSGRTIRLTLNRLPATAPEAEREGPILLNPGGPGGSGLGMATQVPGAMPAEVAGKYDWIGFDPRGTNASEPKISCDPAYFHGPRPDYRVDAGTSGVWLARAENYAKACGAKHGDVLPFLNTADHARDMDLIRRGLGAEKISFFGVSWGTTLGSIYGQLFPRRVHRMVLDSIVGPKISWYDHNVLQDLSHEERFAAFLRWTAANDKVYHLGKDARKIGKLYYRIRTELRDRPVDAAPAPGKIGPSEWDDTFYGGGYNNLRWPRMATAISAYVNKDVRPLQIAYNRYGGPWNSDDSFPIYNAVMCQESPWSRDWGFWKRDQAKIDRVAPFYTYNNMWYNAACMFWPVKSDKHRVRITGKGLPPLLLVQSTQDGATPYSGGLAMRRALPSAKLVVQKGGSRHGLLFAGQGTPHENKCVDSTAVAYLRDGTLPPGTGSIARTCAAPPLPEAVYVNPSQARAYDADARPRL